MDADDILDQLEDLLSSGQVNQNQLARIQNVLALQSPAATQANQAPAQSAPSSGAASTISDPALAAKQQAAINTAQAGMTPKATPSAGAAEPVSKPSFAQNNYGSVKINAPTGGIPSAPVIPKKTAPSAKDLISAPRTAASSDFAKNALKLPEDKIYSKFLDMLI